MNKLRILAIGAHPDDVELGIGGTIAKHSDFGDKCVIIDLTRGEMGTRGTVAERDQESQDAAAILGVSIRENLGLPDGMVEVNDANKKLLVEAIRRHRPHIMITPSSVERHPDHEHAYQLCKECSFLAGLRKYPADGEAWRPKKMLSYLQERWMEPDLVVDISGYYDQKIQAILAYKSQFYQPDSDEPLTLIASEDYMEGLHSRARFCGREVGVKYGEALSIEGGVGVKDLRSLALPDLS